MSTHTSRRFLPILAAVISLAASANVFAHTVSNAYLTFQADAGHENQFHGEWDISLRDLNFVIGLDDNGDGNVTWGELKEHQQQISKYVYQRLQIKLGGAACRITPDKQWVDTHADGAYAVLFFNVKCPSRSPRVLTLDDRLLFDVDPTHRGILVFREGDEISTALLSPAKHEINIKLPTKGG
ncbi:MAG: hypothetical protein ACRES7_04200 [Gammaproteobacteria bacterium]